MVSRHEFLTMLHSYLKPERYLEIGVQYGHSLRLASYSKVIVGVDPDPMINPTPKEQLFSVTSDDYFMYFADPDDIFDLVFIDGSHLFEDALRDFMGAEMHSHPGTIVIFDDVLPYNEEMTSRTMIPGHWTGDVWKVHPVLTELRPDLQCTLVDTTPTGTMIVWGLDAGNAALSLQYTETVDQFMTKGLPREIIARYAAVNPDDVLRALEDARDHGDRPAP